MKNTKLTIENTGTFIEFDIETSNGKSLKKIQHALVLRFFDWHDTMKAIGAKAFKSTMPFTISMSVNNAIVWDTSTLHIKAQAKLKLINNPKGRGKFEYRLTELMKLMERLSENDIDKNIEILEERLMEI